MPSTKIRGKSAVIINDGSNNQHSTTTAPSLLKIESVVPTLTNRGSKLIRRSHSTLSPSYIRKLNDNRKNIGNGNQFTLEVLEEKPTDTASVLPENSSISLQNGICKVKRTPKEKDKLPDRINLDRRGLTAIPFIEDEGNLRLLSLQHNLINTFTVPLEKEHSTVNISLGLPESFIEDKPPKLHQPTRKPPIQRYPKNLSIYSENIIINGANGHRLPLGTNITNLANYNQQTLSIPQRGLFLNSNQKNLLKKSYSFINNNNSMINNNNNLNLQQRNNPLEKNSKLKHMTSFQFCDNTPLMASKPLTMDGSNKINTFGSILPHLLNGFSDSLANLVFLDLYDNQIDRISNLDGLKSLTVLLLGKNRITDISGIVSLKNTLRVLDLHGNKISNISQKICRLQELKSLNLAGNLLKQISANDFRELFSLKELNLKRNRIKKISGFDDLRNLERLWLCHNDLQKVEDMSSVAKAVNLKEVTIENNPVSLAGDCVSFLVSYLPNLISLSQMQVTEQVKRAATAWRKNKEISDSNYSHLSSDVCQNIRREEVISNARTSWELLRSQQVTGPKNLNLNQKLAFNCFQQQISVREVDVELHSNLTETIAHQKRIIKQKTVNNLNQKRNNLKIGRSISQDGTITIANETQSNEDFFRLPPILAPFIEQQNLSSPQKTDSSASSLGPNVDSSSSYYSSDNEEIKKNEIKTPTKILSPIPVKTPSPIPMVLTPPTTIQQIVSNTIEENEIILIEKIIETNSVDEKTSTLSVNSIKTSSESSTITVSSDETKPAHKIPKSANSNRKYFTGSLIRAQTARINSVSTNQSTTTVNSSTNQNLNKTVKPANDREREQGGDFLIEICGRYLNVYGLGALKFIDKQWNIQKATDVHTVKFSYINFNSISSVLFRIKSRFPNADNFIFRETNIMCLGQLNALSEIQGMISLIIELEGNPICSKEWRSYAIYRLSHWGLKEINGTEITEEETLSAETTYSGLSDLVLWSLPESLLQPLLTRLKLEETCTASKMSAKEWLIKADSSLKNVVGKEALQWKKSTTLQEEITARQKGQSQLTFMMENTCNAVEKLQKLETLWPNLLVEMIRNTLLDYSQIDGYIKNLMVDILK